MTNKHRGEFTLKALGKEYTGRFSLNVLAELEDEFDMGIEPLFASMAERPRIKHMKSVFLAGLKRSHPELTADLVGELLQDIIEREGSFDSISVEFMKAARAAFPEDKAATGGQAEAADDPTRKAEMAGGTGPGLSSEDSKAA